MIERIEMLFVVPKVRVNMIEIHVQSVPHYEDCLNAVFKAKVLYIVLYFTNINIRYLM